MSSSDSPDDPRARARQGLLEASGRQADLIAFAPGRVNLIGEHTDYNDGFVLPMALPHATCIAVAVRDDRQVCVRSEGYGFVTFELDQPLERRHDWSDYVWGMAHALCQLGYDGPGWDGFIASDVPGGSGLSSSAALLVATGEVFVALGAPLDGIGLAKAAQDVENNHLGVPSGIMDQLISATAVEGHATLIDCRDLSFDTMPLPPGCTVVVLDTSTRRPLVTSDYAERQASCARVATALGVAALRDADVDSLAANQAIIDPVDHRRASHVITENGRTIEAAAAMRAGEAIRLGRLMNESHESLRDDFEVSGEALDAMVVAARSAPGCLGARMTGAGFAGCAVALVNSTELDDFVSVTNAAYTASTGLIATLVPALPGPGAGHERAA